MELDTEWISDFEISDKAYKQFYKEKVDNVKLYILYVNRDYELFHIKKERLVINNSVLKKKELIDILKKHKKHQEKEYIPFSILKYNITLKPENIKEYIYHDESDDYLKSKKNIEDVYWYDSILFLNNINSLYIVYKEKWRTNHSNTKKIRISKKLKHRKTKKNKLKDNPE